MSRYLKIYEKLCPDDRLVKDDPRRSMIIYEMKRVIKSKTMKEAREVIGWWGHWKSQKQISAFVRKAKKLEMKGGHKC